MATLLDLIQEWGSLNEAKTSAGGVLPEPQESRVEGAAGFLRVPHGSRGRLYACGRALLRERDSADRRSTVPSPRADGDRDRRREELGRARRSDRQLELRRGPSAGRRGIGRGHGYSAAPPELVPKRRSSTVRWAGRLGCRFGLDERQFPLQHEGWSSRSSARKRKGASMTTSSTVSSRSCSPCREMHSSASSSSAKA